MPVAPSYEKYNIVSEIYQVNGKSYIKIQHPTTGNVRQARWYTESEFAKQWPSAEKVDEIKFAKTQKEVLGFEKGYITIFKGDIESAEPWFRSVPEARYARMWGWYVISTEKVPETVPAFVETVRLPWSLVGNEDGTLKNDSAIEDAINSLLYDNDSSSDFQGEIGERIEIDVCVTQNIPLQNAFGNSTLHVMTDGFENEYVWITSAKNWPIGTQKRIRGTVKAHRIFRGVKQTVLTRCSERP